MYGKLLPLANGSGDLAGCGEFGMDGDVGRFAPSGYVHPLALRSIEELGLPIDGLESKSVDLFVGQEIDLAVTVCDHAKEACPVLPGVKQTLHWPFEDPADATGSDDEKIIQFRKIRDQIKKRIGDFLSGEAGQHGLSKN